MNKNFLKFLCFIVVLAGLTNLAEAAQTINGKAIGSVHDVVKEINKGDLSIAKKGLITIRSLSNNDNTYLDVFASVFGSDGSASTKRKLWSNPTPDTSITKYEEKPMFQNPILPWLKERTVRVPVYEGEPKFFRPAVSRKLYNGKRALMFHNIAPNGSLKYFFKTLSNTRTTSTTDLTPNNLVNMVNISDVDTYTSPAFSNAENLISEVYGTGVMSVKGYDREIFVAASGVTKVDIQSGYRLISFVNNPFYRYVDPKPDQEMRLEFFAINADNEGNLKQEPLTALTQTTPFRNKPYIVSMAVGDFDGDKYNNEIAVMINTEKDIRLFVYRLNYSDGKLTLRAMTDASGIHVFSTNLWLNYLEEQPVSDMTAGDFDGDGKDEIALLYKEPEKSNAANIKDERGWREGPMVGDIHCKVYQWNANTGSFNSQETTKSYVKTDVENGTMDMYPYAKVSGVLGLRAAAADLDGDGKSEIVTLLLGYFHRKAWDSKIKAYQFRRDDFYAYPHLAVWTFDRGSTKPKHDDSHVKGGGESGEHRYNFGVLYELAQDKNTKLLGDKPFLEWRYIWYNKLYTSENKNEGTSPDSIRYMYAPRMFSIKAGPFTGTLGNFRTVDDIAVSWRDRDGNDCVTIFKSTLDGNKQFAGFEDGKLAMKDKATSTASGKETFRGIVAVDLAGEGVELDTPTHLRKKTNRSYVAVLNAVPYHVDTVNEDGSALSEQPVNFTYSEFMNGGNMSVSYGRETTDSTSNTVKQDMSQTVETMLGIDPEANGETWAKVKGWVSFASSLGDIAVGLRDGSRTYKDIFENGETFNPLSIASGAVDLLTDKISQVDIKTSTETTTTTIDKEITATTHDAILYTDTARHLWRYPVMTRPLPMWLTSGSRVDSTSAITSAKDFKDKSTEEPQMFITFTMSENSPLHTANSVTDSLYQPIHEEGNFFSYPSQIGDVEGYIDAGVLADETTWAFSTTMDNTGMTFTKAQTEMEQTEKTVEPNMLTQIASGMDMLINGENASPVNLPDSENPKTFTKTFSKSESISYSLQASDTLTNSTAGHTIKMQPFVAKEGAMVLGTAVELATNRANRLWDANSIYRQKSDPALLLPFKFNKSGGVFKANTYDASAMQIRGIKFYVPELAFFSDNRLINGMKYEIQVPLYNASFKDTGNFNVRLSWADNNSHAAVKTPIATVSMNLGGWKNDSDNNKGTAIFEWKPNLTSNKQYYFYVEIDPDNALDEVHEARYSEGSTTINDYGGNNTGFYPFYVYNVDDPNAQSGGAVLASNITAADEIGLAPLYFTDGDDNKIADIGQYLITHSDDSFVTITANFNYTGQEVPYAFFVGYTLTPSGRAKLPNAGINTIVDLNDLEVDDVEDVFMLNDIALFNGTNKVTFTFTPSELGASASEITTAAASATFGIITLTEEDLTSLEEEFYEGVDPVFELEAIADYLVSESTTETYTLSSDTNVFWKISSVELSGTVSTSDADSESDDRYYLDISLETISEDEYAPSDYGKTAIITVSSIAGYTPKGDYEITVQKTEDFEEWTDAGVLRFTAEDNSNNSDNNDPIGGPGSPSGGCDAGISLGTLALLMSAVMAFRKRS